ncbi:MAG: UDP-N-acetylmuramoyl-tripeptide--D-alanyl-D-alanine ligase [Desulfovibrio sp.]|nr:MAG: UDP-N-acetylmuramoyl-tripeptide--D-alanyl-D-alanine ligase [Desulfovibrio sp.]
MNLTLEQIVSAMGASGDLDGRETVVPSRVQTDSRVAAAGDLFFCITGERFDGHGFAADAVRKGACAVVAERPLMEGDGIGEAGLGAPLLMVPNTVAALGKLAAFWRKKAKARVAGVTGSAGKTTVKELLAHVLASSGETHKNQGNLNNQIGLPMSLLAATGKERYWVMEAGISEARDMDELGAVLRPDVAVVVNVGAAHLQGLGGVADVAAHKARLLAYMRPGGIGVVSADYPELTEAIAELRKRMPFQVATFSCTGKNAHYRAEYLGPERRGASPKGLERRSGDLGHGLVSPLGGRFRITLAGEEIETTAPLRGNMGAENVACVAAAAHVMGMSPSRIARGFAGFAPPEQRLNAVRKGKWLLIDDSYNANPLSMAASLGVAQNMAEDMAHHMEQLGEQAAPLVAVLGEMREMGELAAQAHQELGRGLAQLRPAAVFWRGGHGDDVAQGLGGHGNIPFVQVTSADNFLLHWKQTGLAETGGVALVKGSRSIRMEELYQALSRELDA